MKYQKVNRLDGRHKWEKISKTTDTWDYITKYYCKACKKRVVVKENKLDRYAQKIYVPKSIEQICKDNIIANRLLDKKTKCRGGTIIHFVAH